MKKGFRTLAATVLVLALLMFGGTAFAANLSLNVGIVKVYLTQHPPANCTVSTGQIFPNAFYVVTTWSNGSCTAAIDPPSFWFN